MYTKFYNLLLKYNRYIAILILFLFISPYLILREDAYVCLYDILEYLPNYKIIAQNTDYLLAPNDTIIPNMMSGLPRVSYPSEMNIQVWLFYFLPPFYAYFLNFLIIHLVAFYGAKKFLYEQVFESTYFKQYTSQFNWDEKNFLINFSALYFALIPFWTLGGISIAGIPLLLNSFLNLFKKPHWLDYLIIILFPFYSFLVFSNIFLIPALFLIFLFKIYQSKKFYSRFFIILIVFAMISVLTEYRIILASLHHFEHHREFIKTSLYSLSSLISIIFQKALNNLDFYFYPYSDAPSKHYPFLYYFVLFTIFLSLLLYDKKVFRLITFLFIFTFLVGLSYPLSGPLAILLQKILPSAFGPLLNGFTFRLYVLNPFIWFLLLSGTSIYLYQINIHSKKFTLLFLLFFNLYMLLTSGKTLNFPTHRALESPFANNIKNKNIPITYKSYFDEPLFQKIEKFITENYHLNKNEYRVAALTDPHPAYPLFSPSVLLYNNFHTIDGYCVYYPRKYKSLFGQIIEKELNKNTNFYSFKTYGNRVYICSADTTKDGKIKSLDLNYEILKQLNCKFLFSRKKIQKHGDNLMFLHTFQGLYWKINLYEIK